MWRDDTKKLLKCIGYQDNHDLKTFLPYLRENNLLGKAEPHPCNSGKYTTPFECPVTKKFRVKVDYGVRIGSIGLVVGLTGEFTNHTSPVLTAEGKVWIYINRVRVIFEAGGKVFSFDEMNVSRTTKTQLKHVYVSAAEKKAASAIEPIDMFGVDIKLRDVVMWTYNMGVPGGSKPFTAFGTVTKINPKTLDISAIFVRGLPGRDGTILRAAMDNVAVLDDGLMGRLVEKKLKI